MNVQTYPLLLKIYKGERRILTIPVINHIAGYSVDSDWFVNIQNIEDYAEIGKGVVESVDFIKRSPLSVLTPQERDQAAAWRKNSKYKSRVAFWKNNHFAYLKFFKDGHYEVFSMTKSEKRKEAYSKIIKERNLPSDATAEEIGKAVIEVLAASEEYYKNKPVPDAHPPKCIELLDGSALTVEHPGDKHFVDSGDCHAAEIYQCYSYVPKEDAEATAEFFLGIAPELDCDLKTSNVLETWERIYGKADSFEMQEAACGIFRLRGEMRNKNTHKISYFLQMEEDLLLECGMEVHQPNKRKKLSYRRKSVFICS